MCNFFSFVHDGKKIYYFDGEQRKNGVKMPDGNKVGGYDSHSSITCFHGLDDDEVNKFEYNPFTDKLVLDGPRICQWDEKSIRDELAKIDWQPITGDVQGAREFIRSLKDIPWFKPDGTIKDGENGVKLFKTWDAAWNATRNSTRNAAWNAARNVARIVAWGFTRDAAWDAAWNATVDAAWGAARDAAKNAALDAARDAALCASVIYVCTGLPIEPKHIDYAKKCMDVWRYGYGVLCDVDGVLYCYEHL